MEKTERQSGHLLRKSMKKAAKGAVKKHYWIFLAACLLAAVMGTEFGGSVNFIKSPAVHLSSSVNETPGNETAVGSVGLLLSEDKQEQLISDLLNGNVQKARNEVRNNEKESTGQLNSETLGRTRGVLASVINAVSSGSFIMTVIMGISQLTGSASTATIIFIIMALIFAGVVWIMIMNVYQVVIRRIYLEGRIYDKLRSQRFFFLLRVKGWAHAACTMLLTSVFYVLWSFTLVGLVVKYYSYYMVAYIVAENPSIPSVQAITLSRQMMKGHKWECFKIDVTFIGWHFLGVVTGGLSQLFYSNMYKAATMSEYYAVVRSEYLKKNQDAAQFLYDTYLFEKASEEVLNNTYADILGALKSEQNHKVEFTGISGFIAKTFGVVLWNNAKEKEYNQQEINQLKLKNYQAALEGKIYPGRLYPIKEKEKRSRVEIINYLRHYSVLHLIMIFFIISFIGWIWEVSLHLVSDGVFVNRGVQYGPWLPIYGSGGIFILILLNKFRKYPIVEFILSVILCGCVEYFISYSLQMEHGGTKWWDYSGYFLNLNGRICAEGLLVFGLGGMAIVYLVAPMIDDWLKKISHKILIPVCIVLLVIFGIDKVYSGKHPNMGEGITDYSSMNEVEAMEESV